MKTVISLFIVILSFLGIMDASYLTYEKVSGVIPPCTTGFKCSTVLTSKWSSVGPIPLSAFGLLFYSIIFTVAIINFIEKEHVRIGGVTFHTHDLLLGLTIFGAGFSLYLIVLMGLILQAWCLYCLISALICASLFFLSAMLWKHMKNMCSCRASAFWQSVFQLLYVHLAKRIFFLMDAEFVHHRMVRVGVALGGSQWGRMLSSRLFAYTSAKLKKKMDGITFPNPVGLSAGFDYNGDLMDIVPSVGFGFATIGTVTYRPYEGNKKPRLGRFPRSQALLVNKGFKSVGARGIIKKMEGRSFNIPIGISIGSTNAIYESLEDQIQDVVSCFKLFEQSQVKFSYYELNISCPNTAGGQPFTTSIRLQKLLEALKTLKFKKPVYIKMPIDLEQRETLALLQTADAFSFIRGVVFGNLTKDKKNPDVDPQDRQEWKKKAGNLSGKPTWNRSNACISLTKKKFGNRFTIIGTGGIFSGEDAQTKLSLGADLVQLITGMIYQGPQVVGQINRFLVTQK
jgi:dihydroorotate dehydrogenase